jgi:light-independent protochlorophyllide reductase subunit B
MGLPVPVVALELPSYQRKENFGSDETFYQLVRALAQPMDKTPEVTANLIGPLALGFRHRDDIEEVKGPALRDGDRHQRCRTLRCDTPWT